MKRPERRALFLIHIMTNIVISLACHRAEYQIGPECCPMCPAGTRVNKHCTEFRSTSCLPCDEGTYMDEPTGMTQCFRCQICGSGAGLKVKTACSSASNAVCEPQQGHFCEKLSDEGSCVTAQKYKRCEPGQFIQQPGSASANTVCSKCAEGTFSNGTLSRCQPHILCEKMDKVTIKVGTLHSDAECGERSSIPLVIGVAVVIVVIVIVGAVAVFLYKKTRMHRPVETPKNMRTLEDERLEMTNPNASNG